tara:strand:+ start:30 stop:857 length:828 start_codon:yes stop_codon:yes gene_type:complete
MSLYVIGQPVKHSLSPVIHNYWLKKYKRKEVYDKLDVSENDLQNIIKKISRREILGVNITIPYKQKIYSMLDNLDANARDSFAVNTIYRKDNKVYGENTDGKGFCEALIQEMQFNFKHKKILILGAGGASYGVVSELIKRKTDEIFISNRTQKKSELLIQRFNINTKKIKSLNWEKLTPDKNIDLIINATSIGLKKGEYVNMNLEHLSNKVIYSDLIYNPARTETMKMFERKGLLTQNGLGMLVNQAALSFKLWFNINLTLEDIREAKELCEKSN